MLIIKDTQTIFHRMPIVHKLTAILRIKWVKAPTNAQQKKNEMFMCYSNKKRFKIA